MRDVKGALVCKGSRGTKLKRGLVTGEGRCKKRAETGLGLRFLRREKWGSVMRESQCLETDLNLRSDLMGRRRRSSDRRSSLEATMWAHDSWLEDSSRVLILILILTLLTESILLGFVRMGGGSELLYAFCQASLVIWEVSMLRIEKCA